jgi:N-acetyl-anhydromuramyl-L-alanine amidase AmpD
MNAIAQARFKQPSYHVIVTRDGVAHRNMPDTRRGAHVGGNNTGNIGIVYIGGLAADGKTAKDTRTPAQRETLRKLVAEYKAKYPGIVVRGHRDWSPDRNKNGKVDKHEWLKACPSFDVATEL